MSRDLAQQAPGAQRLDKWLWFARIVKSRTLAAGLVEDGKVRVNRERVSKPSAGVRVGDVVTVAVRARVLVLKVCAPGARRGPPAEARQLYEDMSPPSAPVQTPEVAPGQREPGSGRPTKRERRAIDRLIQGDD
jgi:ribosome-associated heat shock protein Hsp15